MKQEITKRSPFSLFRVNVPTIVRFVLCNKIGTVTIFHHKPNMSGNMGKRIRNDNDDKINHKQTAMQKYQKTLETIYYHFKKSSKTPGLLRAHVTKNSMQIPAFWDKRWWKHYENTPIQIYRKFNLQITEHFQINTCNSNSFHIFAKNLDC